MIQPILTLFGRTLTEESRLRGTHLTRAALLAAVLLLVAASQRSFGQVGAAGKDLFEIVMAVNLVFLSLGAVAYLAASIAEEKEDETLGLLRMTRLNGLSILLGKGASRGVGLGVLVLLQVPFTLLTITLGGVSFVQIAAAYCAVLAYVVFLTGLGLLCSVVMRRTVTASVLMSIVLGVYLPGPWLLEMIADELPAGRIDEALYGFSAGAFSLTPFGRLKEILESGFSGPILDAQVRFTAVGGVALFAAAWLLFDRFTREQKGVAPSRGLLKLARIGRWLSAGPIWRNAIAWKDFNFVAGGRVALLAKASLYSVIGAVLFANESFSELYYDDNSLPFRDGTLQAAAAYVALLSLLLFYVLYIYRRERRRSGPAWLIAYCGFAGMSPLLGLTKTVQAGYYGDFPETCMSVFFVIFLLELALAASRLFAVEVRWGTWSNLALLPLSPGGLARRKLAGALPALAPAFWFWVVALALGYYENASFNDLLGWLAALVEAVLCAHIIVMASFYFRHGALPIGVMIYVTVLWIIPIALDLERLAPSEWMGWPMSKTYRLAMVGRLLMIGGMQVLILRRLRRLAGA